MLFFRYVLSHYSVEKERSAVLVITVRVAIIIKRLCLFGKKSMNIVDKVANEIVGWSSSRTFFRLNYHI